MNRKKNRSRVVIGNAAVDSRETLSQALDFSKKPKRTKNKFLNVAVDLYPTALVISWAVAGVGFGEVTYFIKKGKIQLDSEGMSNLFVKELQSEVIKRYKNKKLTIKIADNLLEKFFEGLNN